MSKIKKYLKSSHIQIAIAAGSSILLIAVFSKWVLAEPIDPFLLAVPPLIEAAYEYFMKKDKESKICTTWYWIAAILGSTAMVILFSWI
jgi:hypothetical protein